MRNDRRVTLAFTPKLATAAMLLASAVASRSASAESTSFRNEVMAVISKAGCNQGACHGNQNGKNGFKLSLRGEDPAFDLASLTRDSMGRRANPLDPPSSLILLKATAAVPHEGGQRFTTDSTEYAILAQWIRVGLKPDLPDVPRLNRIEVSPRDQVLVDPQDKVQLEVRAFFSDGSTRDVTRLAVYEPSNQYVAISPGGEVTRRQTGETAVVARYLDQQATARLAFVPARSEPAIALPERNFIDTHVFAKLRRLRIQPSELSSDSIFLRRAYLDAIGRLPTADEAARFLADPSGEKRDRLINELLNRPEFAELWALKWSDLLRNEEKTIDRKGVQAFHQWIRQAIDEDRPLNQFARDLLTGQGSTYRNPAANFYRANRDPLKRAETAAQVFLGLRLQCAKCHNHPFDQWTQDDYYDFAAFFARVQYKIIENARKDGLDQHEFDGEQIVWIDRMGEVKNPRSGKPAPPRLLGHATRISSDHERLDALGEWVARSDNPFFARTQVNRIWYHLMGRGIVEPIDDFRATNPPVNEALLDALASDFVSHGFNLRHTVRTIMQSTSYQLSAVPNDTNSDDESNFSRALVRPLQAEQLLDAYSHVLGVPAKFTGYPLGMRAIELPGVQAARRREAAPSAADQFLKLFGKPERLLACECERSEDTTLRQAFQLISGETIYTMLNHANNEIARRMGADETNESIIEHFYLAALARRPNENEARVLLDYIAKAPDRRSAIEDVVWGLVNAKEFLLRQ